MAVLLRFDPHDDTLYYNSRDHIATAVYQWADSVQPGSEHGDVEVFMDFLVHYCHGEVDSPTVEDIDEYLLHWCPRKVSFQPDSWLGLPAGIKTLIGWLTATQQFRGQSAERLLQAVANLTPVFLDRMSDPSTFGLAKGMFMGPALSGTDISLEYPGSIQAAIDKFNSLSIEERHQLTDSLMSQFEDIDYDLVTTPLLVAPDRTLAESWAAGSPIITQLNLVREFVGQGRSATKTNNPKVADARALAAILGTDGADEDDDFKVRSADDLPHFTLYWWAFHQAGAISTVDSRIRVNEEFFEDSTLEQLVNVATSIIDLGPAEWRSAFGDGHGPGPTVDTGIGHLLVHSWIDGPQDLDSFRETCHRLAIPELPAVIQDAPNGLAERLVDQAVEASIEAMTRCALLVISEGTATITELGQVVAMQVGESFGFEIITTDQLQDLEADELVQALSGSSNLDPEQVAATWRPTIATEIKADQLVAALIDAPDAFGRLAASMLLLHLGPATSTALKVLEGTTLAGYAILAQEDLGFEGLDTPPSGSAPAGTLSEEQFFAVIVDQLTVIIEIMDPGAALDQISTLLSDQFDQLINTIWRIRLPEVETVLEFLGSQHHDKRIAKSARTSLFKYRSRSSTPD